MELKRINLYLLFLALVMCCNAANPTKEYKKLIAKYDIADEAKAVPDDSCAAFWEAVIENNELLRQFVIDIQDNSGAEREAQEKTRQIPRFYPQYEESVIHEMQGFCDTLLIDMGIQNLGLECSLHIIDSDEENAFAALTEGGFAMCVTTALLSKDGMNYYILMGYVAHEFAHGALLHHIRTYYAEAKERRRNNILGGIAIGVNVLAAGVETYYSVTNGIEASGFNYGGVIDRIQQETKISTLKFTFKYCREQEFEADLIAYRFLDRLGHGEDFINGLRILGTQYDEFYTEYSDHPTTSSRICFLEFVQEHPELGNKENKKLKNKRLYQDVY